MKSFIRFTPVTLLMPLLILAGCSHTIPATDRIPQPPPQLGNTPTTVVPLNTTGKSPQASESILPVTLTADLTPVQRAIQAAIPERFTDEGHPLANAYRWQFVREGEPQVFLQDGLVKYQVVYWGAIESTAARACRLDPLFPVLEGTGRLMLREQGEGLLVTMSDSKISINLKPESDSKCNMFNIGVKDQLVELFQQEMINQQISQSLESAGYFIPIQLVWDRLQEPLVVGQANAKLCLYGKAQDFIVGSLKGPAQLTTIMGAARQTPVAVYQTPCQTPATTPPLKVSMDNTAVVVQDGQPYKILLSVPVPYAVLSQQLQDQLFHHVVKLRTSFRNALTIERASASDVNGRSLISVETSGAVSGILYYWGTPRLGHEGNVITIPDLQMANETKMALDEITDGYWQAVDEEVGPRLRQAATIDLAQRIGSMKTALSGQHKVGGLAMELLMGRQEASQVSSTKDALVADVLLEGTASATGRVSLKQQAQSERTERTLLMEAPVNNAPRKAAGMLGHGASESFSGNP